MGNRISVLKNIDTLTATELIFFLKRTVKVFCLLWLYSLAYLIFFFYRNISASLAVLGLMILYMIYIYLFRNLCYLDSPNSVLLNYTAAITVVIFILNPVYTIYYIIAYWHTVEANPLITSGIAYQLFFETNLLSTLYLLRKLKVLLVREEEEMKRRLVEAEEYNCDVISYNDSTVGQNVKSRYTDPNMHYSPPFPSSITSGASPDTTSLLHNNTRPSEDEV
jgi:hypothetical protein